MAIRPSRPVVGALLSLGAAATFGVLTPAGKQALEHLTPLRTAGLAYLVAGLVAVLALVIVRLSGLTPAGRGLARTDYPRLAGMTLLGGVVGPALFFSGLAEIAAHHVAVLQHLEFALTVLAALFVLGERPGRKGVVGILLVGAGVLLLTLIDIGEAQASGASSWSGLLLVVGACVAWAADNTLARGASDLDPLVVVSIKGLVAGSLLIAMTPGEPLPWSLAAWGAVVLAGGVGVGLSLLLELMALRRIGAALNAGLFSIGPAFAFAWSLIFLCENATPTSILALLICVAGAAALALDRHEHLHLHPRVKHSHRHRHDDGHHTHDHGAGFDPATQHVHGHEHERTEHAHPHVHDDHHRHRH
jgi:drug/metabolite transporter (DMT)-like permease